MYKWLFTIISENQQENKSYIFNQLLKTNQFYFIFLIFGTLYLACCLIDLEFMMWYDWFKINYLWLIVYCFILFIL